MVFRTSFGGFLKWWYPQIIYFNWIFQYKQSILGYPHLWKPSFYNVEMANKSEEQRYVSSILDLHTHIIPYLFSISSDLKLSPSTFGTFMQLYCCHKSPIFTDQGPGYLRFYDLCIYIYIHMIFGACKFMLVDLRPFFYFCCKVSTTIGCLETSNS